MSDDARAEQVADEFITCAIPDEESRAGRTTPVDLGKFLNLVAGDVNFVLQDTGRPQHAHDVGLLGLAKPDGQVRRVLSEITGRSIDFKLLSIGTGEDFDFGADGGLVVVEPFQIQAQPVVFVAAFVPEKNSRAMILCDE